MAIFLFCNGGFPSTYYITSLKFVFSVLNPVVLKTLSCLASSILKFSNFFRVPDFERNFNSSFFYFSLSCFSQICCNGVFSVKVMFLFSFLIIFFFDLSLRSSIYFFLTILNISSSGRRMAPPHFFGLSSSSYVMLAVFPTCCLAFLFSTSPERP